MDPQKSLHTRGMEEGIHNRVDTIHFFDLIFRFVLEAQ